MESHSSNNSSGLLCGAKTRNGTVCLNHPVTGKRRCRMHGGAAGSGAPKGNTNAVKLGRYTSERRADLAEARRLVRELKFLEDSLLPGQKNDHRAAVRFHLRQMMQMQPNTINAETIRNFGFKHLKIANTSELAFEVAYRMLLAAILQHPRMLRKVTDLVDGPLPRPRRGQKKEMSLSEAILSPSRQINPPPIHQDRKSVV